ncbi:exopolyphosphatase [Paenalkalicoccus suaedae]|uniref:exopolyphosphatase n=1 Tax=Paenalkalicoccus suaedae TaxID=2592382 RepID=A0A859FCU6_9BACI|nr:exopolyphosphatase [Paenalkalicoccus suaedae]QKS70887.1 exopolyphosphatase [Paenalkalicoccus suaedae]
MEQIGIIDMGSNSIRFVIYEIDEYKCYKEIQNLKIPARLSTYIDDEGAMTKDGIDKVLETLKRFEPVVANYELSSMRGVATAAIRNATNSEEILDAIKEHSIFPVDILSEEQEAYYGYLAVTNSMDVPEGITIDIGGGSTEVTYFKDRELLHSYSFPFGALTLKKQFIKGDTPTEEEWKRLRDFLKESYRSLSWIKDKNVPVIGIGGSARNVAQVHQADISYPMSGLHQYEMTAKEVHDISDELSSMSLKKREKVDGLSKDRADTILPAIAAMEALIKEVNTKSFIVSSRGLRDGLFFELLLAPIEVTHFPNVKEESFYQLSNYYRLNLDHQKKISVLASYLTSELVEHDLVTLSKLDMEHLRLGANVFYIGNTIHPESKSEHTFYLLTNQSIDGLPHSERLAVAFIASFKSKSQLKKYADPYRPWVSKEDLVQYELLGAIIKFSFALNISEQSIIKRTEITECDKEDITITVTYDGDAFFEEEQANKYKKHLEKALDKNITLTFNHV